MYAIDIIISLLNSLLIAQNDDDFIECDKEGKRYVVRSKGYVIYSSKKKGDVLIFLDGYGEGTK